MKKLLLLLALLLLPTAASAQCTGVFGASTVCGTVAGGPPSAIPFSSISTGGITALTGDVTATGPGSVPATLATVNANVGTFGSVTACVTATVNGKGLITAISAATCTPAIGSVTGLGASWATILGVTANAGTVAALPTCTSGIQGARSFVADANSVVFHATAVGGGANKVAVTCDGANWYVD